FRQKFDTERYAKENHLSIQMAARALRYQWFDEVLTQQGYDYVATAHHLNDSIETVLLNFARGTGLEGLDGIASKNGKIIRPLLFATRQQIENYAKENSVAWREDQSNASDDYSRNFIRHKIIPLLKEVNPSMENSFQDSYKKISGATSFLELGIKSWREKFEKRNGDNILLEKKGLDGFSDPVGLLWNLIKSYGFNLDQCTQIAKGIYGEPGKKFSSGSFELVVDRNDLVIKKRERALPEVWIEKGQREAKLGKYLLRITETSNAEITADHSTAWLDADKLQFPLKWRKWEQGDYFYPLGMNHKKKLSNFLIDQKISGADKETITVLESGGEIVWVVGLRIGEYQKISGATLSVLSFHVLIV
ncbi:MAG TPA: tRNA lysidine(34) synthetase TilS, partial [Cyclobacteriaceae bacterium]|nr:tRNA lysidine(34) synthetase TilS [Cyclobacteriaceae bacterium]